MRLALCLLFALSLSAAEPAKAPAAKLAADGSVAALPWCRVTVRPNADAEPQTFDGWWDAETGYLLTAEMVTEIDPFLGTYAPEQVVSAVAAKKQEPTPAEILKKANKVRVSKRQ